MHKVCAYLQQGFGDRKPKKQRNKELKVVRMREDDKMNTRRHQEDEIFSQSVNYQSAVFTVDLFLKLIQSLIVILALAL